MPIKLEIKGDDPAEVIDPVVSDLEKNEPAIRKAVDYQKAAEVDRLNSGDFPPPLKPATLKRKARDGYPLTALVATGTLRDTLETRLVPQDDGYVVASQFYGYIQQYGASSRNLPARKWLYIAPEDEEAIVEILSTDILNRPGLARLRG